MHQKLLEWDLEDELPILLPEKLGDRVVGAQGGLFLHESLGHELERLPHAVLDQLLLRLAQLLYSSDDGREELTTNLREHWNLIRKFILQALDVQFVLRQYYANDFPESTFNYLSS